jgi:hypothetical protein
MKFKYGLHEASTDNDVVLKRINQPCLPGSKQTMKESFAFFITFSSLFKSFLYVFRSLGILVYSVLVLIMSVLGSYVFIAL